jgi:hypothetical protein
MNDVIQIVIVIAAVVFIGWLAVAVFAFLIEHWFITGVIIGILGVVAFRYLSKPAEM